MLRPPERLRVQRQPSESGDEWRQSLDTQEVGTFALAGVCRWRFSTWIQASGSGWDAAGPSRSVSWPQEVASPESWASAGSGGDFSTGEEAEHGTTRHGQTHDGAERQCEFESHSLRGRHHEG